MSTKRRIAPRLAATATAAATALALPMPSAGVSPAIAVERPATSAPAAAATPSGPVPPTSPTRVATFGHPTRIDNPFFPVMPDTELIYTGTVTENGKSMPHTLRFTVSHLTKKIHGITTRV